MTTSTCFLRSTIAMIVFPLLVSFASAQDQQIVVPSASSIAANLHSGDTDKIAEAISYLPWDWTKDKEERMLEFRQSVDPLVAEGLISALDSQSDQFIFLEEGHEDAHYMIDVLDSLMPFVASLEDERAIPALLKATQFGNTPCHALAEFGPRVFPVILDYIESSERTMMELHGGFLALTRTVERWRPLNSSMHTTLRKLAVRYIQGYVPEHLTDHFFVDSLVRRGMFLASSLGDADLKFMVSALASEHPGSVELYLERWYNGPSGFNQQELFE